MENGKTVYECVSVWEGNFIVKGGKWTAIAFK